MVGHLQSRKAKDAVQLFDIVHSVDTLKLAKRLDRLGSTETSSSSVETLAEVCGREGQTMPILLEANVSGEGNKYGFALARWAEDEEQREGFFAIVEEILALAPGGGTGPDDHGSHRGRS